MQDGVYWEVPTGGVSSWADGEEEFEPGPSLARIPFLDTGDGRLGDGVTGVAAAPAAAVTVREAVVLVGGETSDGLTMELAVAR